MNRGYFIIALILIVETLFRLFPYPAEQHDFFLFSDILLSTDTYLYFLFEHMKVIGLISLLLIENTRYKWLLFLFIADLVVYLLNYTSTLFYIYGLPIGMDFIKVGILGVVIIREALNYHYGRHPDNGEHRNFYSNARGNVFEAVRAFSLPRLFTGHKTSGKIKKAHD